MSRKLRQLEEKLEELKENDGDEDEIYELEEKIYELRSQQDIKFNDSDMMDELEDIDE